MKNLSVSEFAKLMDVSPVTVYRWIDKGKVNFITELIDDREVKRIIVTDDVINSNKHVLNSNNEHVKTINKPVITEIQPEENTSNENVNSTNNNTQLLQLLNKMYEDFSKIADDNRYLAELAGQTKLLTDSEEKTKEQFFQLVQENKTLIKLNSKLEVENELLKEKIDHIQKELEKRHQIHTPLWEKINKPRKL
ncbi:MAG: hypothetical protein AB1782_04830 [Cyanobacteriota bacterium]